MGKYPGVVNTEVGYVGGHTTQPTYEQVCSGNTGHAEAVRVFYDGKVITYKALVNVFLDKHASSFWSQGSQYRTAVFCMTPEQSVEAKQAISDFSTEKKRAVSIKIESANTFWRAEEYHQHYNQKHGSGFCRLF